MRIELIPPVDHLAGSGGVLLLYPERFFRLGPLGRVIVDESTGGTTQAKLEQALIREFGEPEDGDVSMRVRQAVNDLIEQGVLRAEGE